MWSQLKDWWTDVFFCILPVPWGVLQRIQWCNTCGFAGNTHQGLVGFSWGSPQLIPSNNESIIELNGICIYMIIHVHTVLIRYYPSWVNYEASSNTIARTPLMFWTSSSLRTTGLLGFTLTELNSAAVYRSSYPHQETSPATPLSIWLRYSCSQLCTKHPTIVCCKSILP